MFLRRLIDLSTSVHKLHHHISLNSEAREDIKWWLEFLPSWNGISMFQEDVISSDSLHLYTDASNIGLGGTLGNQWFSYPWPITFMHFHINVQEVFAVYTAIATWGHQLRNKQIVVHCDNLAIVTVWKSGSCKNPSIMKVIRALFLLCASLNINLLTRHIEGHKNLSADALSRLQVDKFFTINPDAVEDPSAAPVEIWTI